ncbi:hypothetical protein BBW65_07460 [Helicobacter enhydrae]|uniref:Autotransporter domain-containing protein n=1 Tax=Helicobacter enhydrae TaxID=222136 RepID=A0A1B1U770_9HELI|nr:autotransporter outer membrane beta-barrel domain-containing protein [Helicobacter enhydrae]ANV98644.1 hypothetical protein BBW65_07460 [Helicobacter enhydrae]
MKTTQRNRIDKNLVRGGAYKPLIATSLALALSVSVASATDANCPSGNTSAICYKTNGAGTFTQSTITFGKTGTASSEFNQLQLNVASVAQTISNLTFQFKQSGGRGNPTQPQDNTSTLSVSGNDAQIKLINKGDKGLQLGNGQGTLTIDFGGYWEGSRSRKAILNFEGKTPANGDTSGTALKGNLKVLAGGSSGNAVEATFNGDMVGNINISYHSVDGYNFYFNDVATNFTFKNGAKLKGNVEAKIAKGGQNFTFDSGGIEGDIQSYGFNAIGKDKGSVANRGGDTNVNITFKDSGASIKAGGKTSKREILASAGFLSNTHNGAYNRILFRNDGQIGENGGDNKRMSIIAHTRGWRHPSEANNFILFQKQATLYLDKLVVEHYVASDRRNVISLDFENVNRTDSTTNTLDITKIEVRGPQGRNYIGKGLLKFNNGGSEAKDLVINVDENKLTDSSYAKAHTAKGKLTAQRITTTDEGGGTNGIFIENLEVTDGIFSKGGSQRNIVFANHLTIKGGVYSQNGGSNIISIGSGSNGNGKNSNKIGGSGIAYDGHTMKDIGHTRNDMDHSLYTARDGTNILNLEDSATLDFEKRVQHTWDAIKTEFNLNGTSNTITFKGTGTNGSDGNQISNVGLEVGGTSAAKPKDGVIFNFNGNNGTLDLKNSTGATSGEGYIVVGQNTGDKNARLIFNVNQNATIRGNIITQGGQKLDQPNTTTFNIANGKSAEVQGNIKNQKATQASSSYEATDSAQTIFNFSTLAEDSASSRDAVAGTTLKIKNIENTSGDIEFNFNVNNAKVDKTSDGNDSKITTTNSGATTTFNLNNANATITQAIESTNGGHTYLNFNKAGESILTLTGGITAKDGSSGDVGGLTSIVVGDTESPEQSVNAIIKGNVTTQGHGSTTITFNSKDSSLTIKNATDNQETNIVHTAGTLEIDFHSQNGTFKNKVTTNNAGTTKIQVTAGQGEKGNSGIFEKEIQTTPNSAGSGATPKTEILLGGTAGEQGQTNGKATLTLQGATNTITTLTANATESTLNLTKGTATITTTEIGNGSTLNLQAPNGKIKTDTLKLSANATSATLNLSSNAETNLGTTHNFNLLTIGTSGGTTAGTGLTANNLTFVVSVDTQATQGDTKSTIGGVATKSDGTYGHAYSDRIIVHNVGDNSQAKSANLAVAIDPSQTSSIHYTKGKGTEALDNIAVATIKNKNGTTSTTDPLVNLTSVETINGGEKIQVEFVKVATDANGKVNGANGKVDSTASNNTYTTYFLGKAISLGVDNTTQQALTSALSINYDLYIANLNSLNKRMGELRDNPYTQGVWARVFGGLQESNFGLGARTSYVTAQGGYDYALETEGAKNYIGLAFSYMHSKGESNKATQASNAINVSGINTIYLSNIQSSGYEIALYNSYVSNVGLYNDTIAKLSYITSDFSLSNSSDHNNTANNLGFTLSNEVGYRFILGEQQDYFIDPQLELSLGYLNQSDFTTKMKTRSGKGNQLKALQESVFLARTRLGASFGKKIVEQDKNISLYVGTFYEYDLVTGGSNKLTTSTTKAYNPEFASNGRVVLNVGSNLELNQSTRVYVDVEKSFGDKLRTQLQFNLGARYSFGEKTSIENAKAQTTAPLRVGNTPTEETEKAQIVPTTPNKAKDTGTKATNQ